MQPEKSMNPSVPKSFGILLCAATAAAPLAAQSAPAFINPPGLASPGGYTHLVDVPAGMRLIIISGQVALDSAGKVVGPDNMTAQATQVFENLKVALAAAGATFNDVIKLNTYVTSMTKSQDFREVRDRYVNPKAPPASTTVEVRRLFRDEFLVEVEALVAVPAKSP
jgi:enamine deaminase RidA (YjgF/YER057c/UK114 family)